METVATKHGGRSGIPMGIVRGTPQFEKERDRELRRIVTLVPDVATRTSSLLLQYPELQPP
jgi:hypothetical protein